MAHEYVGILLNNGLDGSPSADLTLKNSNGTSLESKSGSGINAFTRTNPSSGAPRIEYFFFNGNVFQHQGQDTWSEPLELEVSINNSITAGAPEFEEFFFDAPQGPLSDGDTLTINDVALTYSGHPGTVAIVDSGGIGSTDFRFQLKDGGTVLDTSPTNAVSYSGSQNSISITSNLEFTNNGSTTWNADGLSCQAKDAGGTWREIDDASFSSVSIGPNATIRFTDVTHNYNYP